MENAGNSLANDSVCNAEPLWGKGPSGGPCHLRALRRPRASDSRHDHGLRGRQWR